MFLDKLRRYFRLRDAAEPIKPEYSSPKNEYYGRVSERFSTAQMILYVVLTVFVLVSLMINSEWITYENFYYFFSDMGDYITASDSEIEDVIYSNDRKQSFAVYGGKFAVAGNSGVRLYISSGRLIIDDTDVASNPKLEESERYLLMYDHQGTEFRVYNIFTQAFSANTDFPIYGADVSDSGDFALITSDDDHKFAVNLYNSKFKLEKTYEKNDYLVDVALDRTGNKIVMLAYNVSGGEMVTEITFTETGREEPYSKNEIDGAMPLYCEFTSSGKLIVVCDNRICTFSDRGELLSETEYEKDETTLFSDINEFGAAVVRKNGEVYMLTVLDKNGEQVYNNALTGAVEGISLFGKYVFVDTDINIVRINTEDQSTEEKETADNDFFMLAKSENELLLCLPTRVKYVIFD